ncbi:MAG: hypothetical protein Q4A90_06705 [Streptococcus sp.]|nr:hypothetical protein [Streptococcus sp.]
MSEQENDYENRPYGFPRDLFASVKLYGIRLFSLLFVFGSPVLAMQFTGNGKVFPKDQVVEYISFVILTFIIALYLMFPFNGGKNNLHAIRIFLTRRRKKYHSIDRMSRKHSN